MERDRDHLRTWRTIVSLTFQPESVESCWDELYPLAEAHWQGTTSYRRHEPFAPSRKRYVDYNQAGFFHLLTARDGRRMAGYFGVYVTDSMHSQLRMATEDTFFLHPDYRGGRNALRFLAYIEQYCAAQGVRELLFSCEIDNESGIQSLLKRLDYQPVIVQYSKHLSTCADSAGSSVKELHVGPSPTR